MNLETLSDVAQRAAASSFRSKADLLAYYANSFTATVEEWSRIRQLSPIVASTFDPDGLDRSKRLTYDLIDYLTDIERATETALKDEPALQTVWFQLAHGEAANPKLTTRIIERCGRIYAARRLEPWKYHQHDRYPKRRTTA